MKVSHCNLLFLYELQVSSTCYTTITITEQNRKEYDKHILDDFVI